MEKRSSWKTGAPIVALPWWKRGFDLTCAWIGLVLLVPLLILVALYIRLAAGGPILFKHRRFGYQGEPLYVWKFRTMHVDADPARHQTYVLDLMQNHDAQLRKMDNHSQLIPLGKWLRCTAIDELPQLINVLKGEMSLVGPRPDVVPVEQYPEKHRKRFDVLPGLTGLWQISGKNHTTFHEMNQLDVSYVERRSLLLDLKIVTLTVPAILKEVGEDFVAKRFRPIPKKVRPFETREGQTPLGLALHDRKHTTLPIERQHDSTT